MAALEMIVSMFTPVNRLPLAGVLRLVLLALVLLWGAGTLLSLVVNRAQIYQAQETARVAADTRRR
jgi:hypothetical protein